MNKWRVEFLITGTKDQWSRSVDARCLPEAKRKTKKQCVSLAKQLTKRNGFPYRVVKETKSGK